MSVASERIGIGSICGPEVLRPTHLLQEFQLRNRDYRDQVLAYIASSINACDDSERITDKPEIIHKRKASRRRLNLSICGFKSPMSSFR